MKPMKVNIAPFWYFTDDL